MTFSTGSFTLFLGAALVIALTPGPGLLYVAARTLGGGRREGLTSSVGLGLGGLVHVVAGAAGLSALLMASAEAFTALKLAGAAYLVWLGIKTIREASVALPQQVVVTGAADAFREGVLVESLNRRRPRSSSRSFRSSSSRRTAISRCNSPRLG
jgi:threonine/homoserine/homoserine lactone efflux protein